MPILVPLASTAAASTARTTSVVSQTGNPISGISRGIFADGLVEQDFSRPEFEMDNSQQAIPGISSYDMIAKQKREQDMTRKYFNYAFGKDKDKDDSIGTENVAITYPESILAGQSTARELAEEYLNKNDWDKFHTFTKDDDATENNRKKELFLDKFIKRIQQHETNYRMKKSTTNPLDPNNESTLLRNFNKEYSKCLQEADLPLTLRDGTNRMMNSEYAKTREIERMTEAANPVRQPVPVLPEQKSWWQLRGGRKTARNFIRNGKKTSAYKLKRRSSKHMVRHRKSKCVHHTRRKQTRRHRHSRHRR